MTEAAKNLTATVRVIELDGKSRLTKQMAMQLDVFSQHDFDKIDPMGRVKGLTYRLTVGLMSRIHEPSGLYMYYHNERPEKSAITDFVAIGRERATGNLAVSYIPIERWQEAKALPLIVLGR